MAFDPSMLTKMSPKPPPTLSKETIGVWHGWCNSGNKEVAREAAAKGSHVDLAITFLSYKKHIDFQDAEIWFRNEVIKWIYELLERKQIFKASHILNNINLDPETEFSNILYKTSNRELREYIGNHLIKNERLSDHYFKLWTFFNLISENLALILSSGAIKIDNLESLDRQSLEWKAEIATILFIKTDHPDLMPFITGETLWKHLLANNDIKHIQIWINLRHKPQFDDINDNIAELFKKHHITPEMLEFEMPPEIEDLVLNEFSKFGIFRENEKHDFLVILKRLNSSHSIGNLYDIFRKPSSLITMNQFTQMLIDFCAKKDLLHVLNVCIENFRTIPKCSKYLKLICDYRLLVKDFNEISLRDNIFNTSLTLAGDKVDDYFAENPLVLLALIIFTKDVNILDLVTQKASLVFNKIDLSPSVPKLFENFSTLTTICYNKNNGLPQCKLNYYDLIDRHLKIETKTLFKFRFDLKSPMPHFNCKEIVESYAYSKKINYKFYLNQARPSIATKMFLIEHLNLNRDFQEDVFKKIEQTVSRIAILNFDSRDITASCVAFLEMIGRDSSNLRITLGSAGILIEANYRKAAILEILNNSVDDPYMLQNLLETILFERIEDNLFVTGSDLVEALKAHEILMKYSKINNLKLPECMLRYCASNNLWLPFLIFIQIHNYPIDQVKLLIQFFKSPNMLEHLTHGVIHDIEIDERNVLIKERDTRVHFLSKVGVRQNIERLNLNPSLKSQTLSLASDGSGSSSELFEIDIYNFKATLLQTLIRCHNSTDPPKALLQACQLYRNPLLAVFATSYEPDSIVTNWLTWLAVSCELCQTFTNYETVALNANSVANLLEDCLKNQYPKTLLESFEIFLPDNPLKVFLEFVNCCCKFDLRSPSTISKLETFQTALKNTRKNSVLSETDHEMTYLNNRMWIETIARRLLASVLNDNCTSTYQQIIIVEALHDLKIWNYFTIDFPNLCNLLNNLKALFESNSGVKLDIGVVFDVKNSREAIVSCINNLLEKQCYKTALQVAQIENLPPDLILVKEWHTKMTNQHRDQSFWIKCDETLMKHDVTADCVVDFYIDCSEKLGDLVEKFTVLKSAWDWASKFELSCQHELEQKMWISFLYLDEKHKDLSKFAFKQTSYLYRDLLELLKQIPVHENELTKEFSKQIEKVLVFALNKGDFWQALRLQKMFNCQCGDLESLKLCHSLAEGILLPFQLNAQQRLLLSNMTYLRSYTHRRTLLSTRVSSLSSSSHSPSGSLIQPTPDSSTAQDSTTTNDTLTILKLLSEHIHNGSDIAKTIFMTFRISINIEIPYQVIVASTDNTKMLKDAIEDDCLNKLDVVHDFIQVNKWDKNEVADFICEELINAATKRVFSNAEQALLWDLDVDQDFQLVLQLLYENCSVLGHKIYSYCGILYKKYTETDSQFSDLVLMIELLIRAHDCFTADCNMEGISIILKTSKEVISSLLILKEWKSIVRLLTGVARYTEMNYVFKILMENDQFEFLLRKNLKKDNTLKIALLDFLKKFCPDNKDLYKIVALHFTLFSEVAILWEREAQSVIKNLISISRLEMQNSKLNPDDEQFVLLQNNESTRGCLNKAMANYKHATDFHLQGEKLTKAMHSAKQAELIALQLGLFRKTSPKSSVECILNITPSQINTLISSKLTFEQSLILVEAYNFHVDWASILHDRYVVNNNLHYFQSFLQHLSLTDTLVNDISRKFVSSKTSSLEQVKCMKNILAHLPSIHVKYRIASELGFTDFIEDLIASDQLVYLKDTVWKRGYKN